MNYIYSDIKRYIETRYLKIFILITFALWLVIYAYPKQNSFKIIFCQVGQGDAILIQQGFQQMLIDSGPGSGVLDCLERHMPFFDRKLEMAIITHPEYDHASGLVPILERYELMSFVYNGMANKAEFWAKLSQLIIDKEIPVTIVSVGDKIKFGSAEFEVLWPAVKGDSSGLSGGVSLKGLDRKILGVSSSRDANLDAIVLKLVYRDFSALFTGDISSNEESVIASDPPVGGERGNLVVDVLKVAHHGSKYSTSQKFLEAVRPAVSVIQVGKNTYGHPTKEVLDRLTQIGSKIFRTDQDGDIVVVTDGDNWNYKNHPL